MKPVELISFCLITFMLRYVVPQPEEINRKYLRIFFKLLRTKQWYNLNNKILRVDSN